MANIREKRNIDGKLIAFLIRVYRGCGTDDKQLKPYNEMFKIR